MVELLKSHKAGGFIVGAALLSLLGSVMLATTASAHTVKLATPTGLHATVLTTGDVELDWNAVTNASDYPIEMHGVVVGIAPGNNFEVHGLSAGHYEFRVRAEAAGFRDSEAAKVTARVSQGGAPSPSSTTPSPTMTIPPTTTAGTCSSGTFPTSYFAPVFSGLSSPDRTFTEQFIRTESGYIETCYPAGSSSPSSGHPGGAQAKLAIAAGPATTYTLTYQVRFPVGFQFVKGGKMPGLCGGQCWTGSNNGAGGWSTRYMWRANGVAEVLLSDATTTGYGTDLFRTTGNWNWQADGLWHTIAQTVVMNNPGQADGSITVFYDGKQVAQQTGVTFRSAGDTDAIDSMIFTTFFGGHDSSWAPSSDQVIDWRDFAVS